ncbi:unnamed protein product, partial [marine sediment metagenome]
MKMSLIRPRRTNRDFNRAKIILIVCFYLLSCGYGWASNKTATFSESDQILTFLVDRPCSVVIYLGDTPKILLFYKDQFPCNFEEENEKEEFQSKSRQIALEIFDLINRERIKNKLLPLEWNEKVCNVAEDHSADMEKRGYFEHKSPGDSTLKDRLHERANS